MSDFDFKIDDREWNDTMARAKKELSAPAQDVIVEKSAHEVRRDLVMATPARSGGTRNAWMVTGSRGERAVINTSAVMRFLENGTPENNPGAKIFPKHGKVLAIPIIAAGRKTSMTQTVRNPKNRKPESASKFIFRKWVHGMKPLRIVEKYVPTAGKRLLDNVMGALNKL
jgi:hypothetical protein